MASSPAVKLWVTCLVAGGVMALAACHNFALRVTTKPPPPRVPPATVTVKDPELEQRAARLQLRLLEDEARLEDMQTKLDEARQEVVRAMAKLQTLATRAEAASAMAEAKIALDSLSAAAGPQPPPEVPQAAQLLAMSSAEFDKQNYGGALYLANQAKGFVGMGKGLLASRGQGSLRPGEVTFALPLKLRTVASSNLRDGPGTGFKVALTLDAGTAIVAFSYADVWVHVTDDEGHSGWILYTLVGRRQDAK